MFRKGFLEQAAYRALGYEDRQIDLLRDDVEIGCKLAAGNVGKVGKKVTLPLYLAPLLFESLATRRVPRTHGSRCLRRGVGSALIDPQSRCRR